ncbi:hypothetical protein Q4603_21575 [Zobellia galactanivorans]|uniref:hypothetical protein n=1 Tax=Zobellia galactanivorans (strain DSM 12802 / CCUG 47099 / CIP 106680 / NCIMB 13871 / Dsij) TaxID=63186 RepID=UPI0026E1D252|nr:hypothetical protein [Zobellia galactanivorans]MDO6811222.1 hypothetical protein [Zobellia galactanivorans]
MKIDNTLIAKELRNYKFLDDSRPGYFLQVNSQNCYYDIRVNDLDTGKYFDPYPSYSVRIPLNQRILKSGEQSLSVKVLPFNGDTLSKQASLQLRLMMYPDMTDKENDYGGSTVLWEWEMPHIEQDLPLFAMDTVFEAKVPYEINILDKYALDLSKMDGKKLLPEVLHLFQQRHRQLKNHGEDKKLMNDILQRAHVQLYYSQERISELSSKTTQRPNEVLQPLENYELRLYGNGRIVTLLNTFDYDSAIWWADKDTGEPVGWQPFYLFKNKVTGEWHTW